MPAVEFNGEKYKIKDGFLDLSLLEIADISDIKGLDKLEIKHLELSSNEITELHGLERLKDLEILNCGSNNLTKISGLENLSNLKILHLASNQIAKIRGLDELTELTELYLRLLKTYLFFASLKKVLPNSHQVQPLLCNALHQFQESYPFCENLILFRLV